MRTGDLFAITAGGAILDAAHEFPPDKWHVIAPDLPTWITRTLDEPYYWTRKAQP